VKPPISKAVPTTEEITELLRREMDGPDLVAVSADQSVAEWTIACGGGGDVGMIMV